MIDPWLERLTANRIEKIIIESCEQSNRIDIPKLEKCQNLNNFLKKNNKKIELIFTDLNTENKKLHIKEQTEKPICIIVGPEGDFSEIERKKFYLFNGVNKIKINENILRSETAAISALSIINYALNL